MCQKLYRLYSHIRIVFVLGGVEIQVKLHDHGSLFYIQKVIADTDINRINTFIK